MKYTHEHSLVRKLSDRLMQLMSKNFGKNVTVTKKTLARDIVSSLDTAVEEIILRSVSQAFPHDTIISEESSPDFNVLQGRTWLIDPLCGSHNVARGIPLFVSNIALIEKGKIVAAWVIDYLRDRLVWSTGRQAVYSNTRQIAKPGSAQEACLIDFEGGYFWELAKADQAGCANVLKDLFLKKEVELQAYNSSVGFLYVATGQIHGALTINVRPWDVLAACFLIEQNGGVVTNFDGSPWSLNSRSLIMAGDQATHILLLDLLKKHKLSELI